MVDQVPAMKEIVSKLKNPVRITKMFGSGKYAAPTSIVIEEELMAGYIDRGWKLVNRIPSQLRGE